MLSPELQKLLNDLRAGEINIKINHDKLQQELELLEDAYITFTHSLSMSTDVCPTCGRKL